MAREGIPGIGQVARLIRDRRESHQQAGEKERDEETLEGCGDPVARHGE
jgi:hypothetical protein